MDGSVQEFWNFGKRKKKGGGGLETDRLSSTSRYDEDYQQRRIEVWQGIWEDSIKNMTDILVNLLFSNVPIKTYWSTSQLSVIAMVVWYLL